MILIRRKKMKSILEISVVIPTVFRERSLERCIRSILEQEFKVSEIIIVSSKNIPNDFGYRFDTDEDKKKLPLIKFITSEKQNVQIQKKMGFNKAKGEIICFLDDDIVLRKGFFNVINDTFLVHQANGVQPLVLSPRTDNGIKKFFKKITLLNTDSGKGKFRISGFPGMPFYEDKYLEIEIMNGCSCFEKDVISEDDFDEDFGVTHLWEDVWFSSKIHSKGNKFIYSPKAVMDHFHEPGGRRTTKIFCACYIFNHFLLWNKYISKNLVSTFAYCWARICGSFGLLYRGIRNKEVKQTIKGLKLGAKWIKKYKSTGTLPDEKEIEYKG